MYVLMHLLLLLVVSPLLSCIIVLPQSCWQRCDDNSQVRGVVVAPSLPSGNTFAVRVCVVVCAAVYWLSLACKTRLPRHKV